jgi:hypothetical protein
MAMVGGLNAKRFAGKPLRQPTYSFKDIPRCNKDLEGSSLFEVTDRDQINNAMAEMILLCNETMRRLHIEQKVGKRTSKPLSLEYIADRLDIDDPMFGYFVRTDTPPPNAVNNEKWKKGMLQGFITVTTFTNWQKTFRWDSMHDSAFAYDHEALAEAMASGERKFDEDGTIAEALQSTVRCGDPWNEGIVWPRIAEISLLGGMGCGKALVSLVIEKLECMKPSTKRNYEYVCLQATENSIPFYESLGFVRVGGITEDDKFEEKQAKQRGEESPQVSDSSSSCSSGPPPESEIVSSAVDVYVTKEKGETPADVAKKFNVDVWDIIFLNHYVYKDIGTRSRLMKGTTLYVPSAKGAQAEASSHACRTREIGAEPSAPQWYIAEENDTPRMIAKQFDVSCTELVNANRSRLPELQWQSRLKEGTRIKVSHFHIDDDKHVPYCHWTFPDDSFEMSEPSYMMVRKLDRRKGTQARARPVETSFAVPVSKFTPPPADLFNEVKPSPAPLGKGKTPKSSKKRNKSEPKKPKRPLSGYMIFCSDQRDLLKEDFEGMPAPEVMKALSKMWRELSEFDKAAYQGRHEAEKNRYEKAMQKYQRDLAAFYEANPELKQSDDGSDASSKSLFNKVVKLNAEGMAQTGSEYEYYFVLTFIPDLCWAHLAPLECVGIWGHDKPKSAGRPIWMLVDESEGKEVDISGSFCIPIRSRAMKRTVDADCEQWDILDADDSTLISARKMNYRRLAPVSQPQNTGRPCKTPTGSSKKSTPRIRKNRTPGVYPPGAKRRGRPPKDKNSASKPPDGSAQSKTKGSTPSVSGTKSSYPDRPHMTKKPSTSSLGSVESRAPDAEEGLSPLSLADSVKLRQRGSTKHLTGPSMEKAVNKKRERLPLSPSSTLSGDDDWEMESVEPKRRGRPRKQQQRSATKPLGGAVIPKKRKRGRPPKRPVEYVASNPYDEEDSRPAKRRKLPRRDSAAAVTSYRDVEPSDIDDTPAKRNPGRPSSKQHSPKQKKGRSLPRRSSTSAVQSYRDVDRSDVELTPAKRTPSRKRRETPIRSVMTPDVQQGISPTRSVALTRSAKKLSMSSPLMFSPRRGRSRACV